MGGRLARAAGRRPGRRPAVVADAAGVLDRHLHRAGLLDGAGRRGAQARDAGLDLPPDVPGAGRRRLQRVPGRRPVQPVRRLRDPAVRLLRAADPRRHGRADPGRHHVRAGQRAVLAALPDRDRRGLRRLRHGQPGPAVAAAARRCRRTSSWCCSCCCSRVFSIKAAVFPLSAWLPDSYPTAPAPVTAVFAGLLTKVGVYAIIRTQTLLFPDLAAVGPADVGGAGHHDHRHPRGDRPGRDQADAVLHPGQPHRLHDLRGGAGQRGRASPARSSTPPTTSPSRRRCSWSPG